MDQTVPELKNDDDKNEVSKFRTDSFRKISENN